MELGYKDPFTTPIVVIGPNGEETKILATDLFDRLNESGHPWEIMGYDGREIAVFINGGSLELEVIY